jgi:hypothetical protein
MAINAYIHIISFFSDVIEFIIYFKSSYYSDDISYWLSSILISFIAVRMWLSLEYWFSIPVLTDSNLNFRLRVFQFYIPTIINNAVIIE